MGASGSVPRPQYDEYKAKIVKDDGIVKGGGTNIDFHGGGDEWEPVTLAVSELMRVTDEHVIDLLGPSVKVLNLKMCENITDKTLEKVVELCVNLVSLNVAYCKKLTDQSIMEVAKNCPNLTSLNVAGYVKLTNQSIVEVAKHSESYESECQFLQ